jgi:hypothetical protein
MLHTAHVSHHLPSRLRLKVPRAKGDPPWCQHLRQVLLGLPGLTRVEINPVTGSVLLHYDAAQHEEFLRQLTAYATHADLFALRPPALSEAETLARTIEAEAGVLATQSETARRIVTGVEQLNIAIKRATGNTLDLNVLLPLGLAFYAFFEVGAEVTTPLWVTLGIFSFNSFVALHAARHGSARAELPVRHATRAPAGAAPRQKARHAARSRKL